MLVENVVFHIVDWLKNYSIKSNSNGFIVGVSGGVDSSVVSTLCAMTGYPTYVLSMRIFNYENLSRLHIEWLKNNFENITHYGCNLEDTFGHLIESSFPFQSTDLVLANAQSRLRMLILYAYASQYNSLVVGTGNKVEDFGVGFFTKYGDGGVDISPIADLYKSEVYEVAKYLNIDQEIIDAEPSDGLWLDQRTDEEQLGATYEELEWAMKFMNDFYVHLNTELTERQKEVLDIYKSHYIKNEHKMKPVPVCKIPDGLK